MLEIHNRPEADVLLCCARVVMDDATAARIKALAQAQLDWDWLLPMATEHRVTQLLHFHLNALCPEIVPTRLRQQFQANTQRNLFLSGELIKLQQLFAQKGIPLLPYKGPVLAAAVYGNLALRQFFDLDVLVRRTDVASAKALLAAHGFRPQLQLSEAQETSYLRSDCQFAFTRGDSPLVVEVHWEITPRYFACALDSDRFWERAETVSMGGAAVQTFSREDLLLVLCVHGAKHLWAQLGWICDVAELLRVSPDIEWKQLLESSRAAGCQRILSLGLVLAKHALDAPLPERITLDSEANALAAEVGASLFGDQIRSPQVFERSPHQPLHLRVLFHPFHLQVRERLRDKLLYCLRLGLTPGIADWKFVRLHPLLFWLYYVVRPMRLAGKYALRFVRRIGSGRSRTCSVRSE